MGTEQNDKPSHYPEQKKKPEKLFQYLNYLQDYSSNDTTALFNINLHLSVKLKAD